MVTAVLLVPQPAVAQVEIPDTIHGKGFFIGQLNLAKHIELHFIVRHLYRHLHSYE